MDNQDENYASVKDRAIKKLERDMGPLLLSTLHDPRTIEIMFECRWQIVGRTARQKNGMFWVAQGRAIRSDH